MDQVDAVLDGHEVEPGEHLFEVVATSSGPVLFVVDQGDLPEYASGVVVDGRQFSGPLQQHASFDDGHARSPVVAVVEQAAIGGGATKPQHTQRSPHQLVL